MSNPIVFPIRIVLYREESVWIAHCLEFDVIGNGNTKKRALADLAKCIAIQVEQSVENRCRENLFHPADGETWRRWAVGKAANKDVANGFLKIHIDDVEIPVAETREYSDVNSEHCDNFAMA